jgi:hypothetical protein
MMLHLEMIHESHLHIFSIYERSQAVKCPSLVWFDSVLASLKMKNGVLIYEKPIMQIPNFDSTKRWSVEVDWIWISPRAYGPISTNFSKISPQYEDFKLFLSVNK